VNRATLEVAKDQDAAMEAIMAFDNLVDEKNERDRLNFALTNLMNAPETETIGMGDLVDERLTRSIEIVAKGYGLERLPEASEIFDRSFLPPVAERTFAVEITN
jgi:NitT/TauT family transport system substrate-binding protein